MRTIYRRAHVLMVGTRRFAHPTFCHDPAHFSLVGQITKNLSSPVCKNIPLNMSAKSAA
jgi:hypothetical protein